MTSALAEEEEETWAIGAVMAEGLADLAWAVVA